MHFWTYPSGNAPAHSHPPTVWRWTQRWARSAHIKKLPYCLWLRSTNDVDCVFPSSKPQGAVSTIDFLRLTLLPECDFPWVWLHVDFRLIQEISGLYQEGSIDYGCCRWGYISTNWTYSRLVYFYILVKACRWTIWSAIIDAKTPKAYQRDPTSRGDGQHSIPAHHLERKEIRGEKQEILDELARVAYRLR